MTLPVPPLTTIAAIGVVDVQFADVADAAEIVTPPFPPSGTYEPPEYSNLATSVVPPGQFVLPPSGVARVVCSRPSTRTAAPTMLTTTPMRVRDVRSEKAIVRSIHALRLGRRGQSGRDRSSTAGP